MYTPFHHALNFVGSFTLECRFKITPGTGGFKANLIAKGDGTTGYEYGLNLMNGHAVELYCKSESGFVGLVTPRHTTRDGEWMHIAGVVDQEKKELCLYHNGRRVAYKSLTGEALDTSGPGALRLGCAAGLPGFEPFYGLIDEVRLWKGARTERQIRSSHKAPLKSATGRD